MNFHEFKYIYEARKNVKFKQLVKITVFNASELSYI
jgi:hypothetical protein